MATRPRAGHTFQVLRRTEIHSLPTPGRGSSQAAGSCLPL